MQGLHYRAIDQNGHVRQGFALATNLQDLDNQVHQRGWQLLPESPLLSVANKFGLRPRRAHWSQTAAALFVIQLSQLLEAGVPMLVALDELADLEQSRGLKRALVDVSSQVDQGRKLSDAFASFPHLFNHDCIAAVRAGEASGKLSRCLRMLGENQRWQASLVERSKTLLVYPLFAFACLIGVLLFVLLYLVPAMLPMLTATNTYLPLHTRLLLSLSAGLIEHSAYVLAGLLMFFAVVWFCIRGKSPWSLTLRRLLLKTPYGKIGSYLSLARYARTTALLYESGVGLTESMHIAQDLVHSTSLRNELDCAREQVLAGQRVSDALKRRPVIPSFFVRMVSAGESAGVIDVALRQCADQMQSSAQYSLDRIERLLGPVLLCLMGGILLWTALSVLGPIYNTVSSAGSAW